MNNVCLGGEIGCGPLDWNLYGLDGRRDAVFLGLWVWTCFLFSLFLKIFLIVCSFFHRHLLIQYESGLGLSVELLDKARVKLLKLGPQQYHKGKNK